MIAPETASPIFEGLPLRLMRTAELAQELESLMDACGTTQYPQPMPDDAEWQTIILSILPQDLGQIGSPAWLLQFPERQRSALGLQASRLRNRLRAVPDHDWGQLPVPEWVLAQFDRRDRLQHLLGTGQIPVAWVQMTELLG